jgi:hypothetical protein
MELKRLIPLVLLALPGCQRDQWDDCVTSTGPQRKEERQPGAFSAIDLGDRIDLVLESRAPGTIAVEGGRNLIGQVETEVQDGALRIRSRIRCNWVRSFKPRITVHAPLEGLCRLTLRGTGEVRCADTLRCGYFLLEQWGAEGGAELLLRTTRCDLALHTGAGAVRARGRTERAELFSGIMAPIDAGGLRADDCAVRNDGVADIRCWAAARLWASLSDAGDVYYRGDPSEVESTVTGSGRLFRAD